MSGAQGTVGQRPDIDPVDPFTLRYKILGEIGEGSYSKVLKCRSRETGDMYACKRLKHSYKSWSQVIEIPEILTLRKLLKHTNILQMSEIHFDPIAGRVSLVFELMDMNLYELIKDRKRLLQENRVRSMIFQLIRGLRHLHKHGIFHRDVKPENILLKRIEEEEELLKLGDLGSVRGLHSRAPYTEYISTRWYRSPECLLTPGFYSLKMDIWATGCVFYEVLTLRPLFPGASEIDQINRIHNIVGPPPAHVLTKFLKHMDECKNNSTRHSKQTRFENIKKSLTDLKNGNGKSTCEWFFGGNGGGVERLLPNHVSPEARDLLATLLHYDSDLRPTAHRALSHPYFTDLRHNSRLSVRANEPAEVLVSIGSSLKTLSEVDGLTGHGDLKTLGDFKVKRLPREAPSRIPVRLPRQVAPPVETKLEPPPAPPPPPVGLKVRKVSSINTYNLNNTDSVKVPSILKEEIIGRKVKSYDEFTQKSQASLPYEIVHIDPNHQHRPIIRSHPKVNQGSEGQVTDTHSGRTIQPSPRRQQAQAQASARTDKGTSDIHLIHTLSPSTLRRLNDNRRLAQLDPIPPKVTSILKETMTSRISPSVPLVSSRNEAKKRESTPIPTVAGHRPTRKFSFQLPGPEELAKPVREQKRLPAPDLNWNYRKVREENLSPPPLTQRLKPSESTIRQNPSKVEPIPTVKPKPSLIDYQQFSARYKEKNNQVVRRRREEIIPSADSSSSDYSRNTPELPRGRPAQVVKSNRKVGQEESETGQLNPLQRFLQDMASNPPKKPSEVDNTPFDSKGTSSEVGKKSDEVGSLFTSNSASYYPSVQGRIRVSKPSMSIRSPSSSHLTPPPLLRHTDKVPFSLNLKNPRDPPTFQREKLTKKKYSFLHDKQDFVYKSKLG